MRARLLLGLVVLVAWLLPGAAAQAQDATTVEAQLARAMRGASAASGAFVRDLDNGQTLFDVRGRVARIPASVEKLYTTSTLWLRLGPRARLQTRVFGRGYAEPDGTVWRGDLYLEGGGDPSLSATGLAGLARQIADAGIARVTGRVVADESFFDTARGGPRTGFAYDSDLGGVLGGLTVNRGWSKQGGPAAEAARRFVAALETQGVRVGRAVRVGVAPSGARLLASLRSPTVAQLTRATLLPSDNFYAETLLKALGARAGAAGTTAAGAAVVREEMGRLGLRPAIADGSGLSRANLTSPRQVVGLLGALHTMPIGPAFESAMARIGRTGTVSRRMRGTAAQGACRAKTGTLRDVSALVGICTTAAGRTVAFSLLMNSTSIWKAHAVQDRMVATLARYSG
jgi:D-alanyl-D-alanine carboxypeptidase/D-alanyl-D-alanine-endopeptidase (penicillin-binding protein 4)